MIQNISPSVFSNEWQQTAPRVGDRVFLFLTPRETLVNAAGDPPLFEELTDVTGEYRYLFSISAQRYFLLIPDAPVPNVTGYDWVIARSLRTARPMERALAVFTAIHLNNWYSQNRFCGRCGHPTVPGTDERKMVCPRCGSLIYPRLNPAVIVAVTDGDRLLMTKYANRPTVQHFVLIAGFVEIGETAEQCVAREVMEEVGVRVKNIRYAGSQPWGSDGNLTLGYYCELDGDGTIRLDNAELGDGRWFDRAEVPVPKDEQSITAHMIRAFHEGREWETPFS